LSYLIMWAFGVNDYQLIGGPAWMPDRYDVVAKPGASKINEMRQMLRELLEERFQLKAHRENREQSEFALVVSKGGSKLKEPKDKSCPTESGVAALASEIPCGRLTWSRSYLAGRRASMQMLVFVLSQAMEHKVVNETGLTGLFDMELRWTPSAAAAQAADDAPPSLVTAVQEQMGLKLAERKGLTEVVVVDHVERPSEN
jgi:uncharacterized protein (TIGR03435 family)